MPISFSRLTGTARRRAVLIGAGALTIAAVGAGTTGAFAATTPSASPSASASMSASATAQYPSVRAILRALPGSLRADLKTLKSDPKSEKAAERRTIEGRALSGAYGRDVERVAHLFRGARGASVSSAVPAALAADLKTLRGEAKGSSARTAEVASIWQKALAGTYGTPVQTAAKAADARFEAHHRG